MKTYILALSLLFAPVFAQDIDLEEHARINTIEGYTPSVRESQYTDKTRQALHFKIDKTDVYVRGFYDPKNKNKRSAEQTEREITRDVRASNNILRRVYTCPENDLPDTMIFNPGSLIRVTDEDRKYFEDEKRKNPDYFTKRHLKSQEGFFEQKGVFIGALTDGRELTVSLLNPDLKDVVPHEFAHILQHNHTARIMEGGKNYKPSQFIDREPFGYFVDFVNDPNALITYVFGERGKRDDSYNQTAFAFDLYKTHVEYFDVRERGLMKLEESMENKHGVKKLSSMMTDALDFYVTNQAVMDTLLVESRSHTFPIDVYMATKYDCTVSDTEENKLVSSENIRKFSESNQKIEEGVKICYDTWNSKKTRNVTPALLREISDFYIVGGSKFDFMDTKFDDVSHAIKRSLRKYTDREKTQIYHAFCRRLGREALNIKYNPELTAKILGYRYIELASHFENVMKRDKEKGEAFKRKFGSIDKYSDLRIEEKRKAIDSIDAELSNEMEAIDEAYELFSKIR